MGEIGRRVKDDLICFFGFLFKGCFVGEVFFVCVRFDLKYLKLR